MKKKYTKKITKLIDSLIINTLLKVIYKIKYFFVWHFWNLTKKFNKILNNLIKKPLLNFFIKIHDLTSYFFRKKITKNFNTFTQKIFFKLDDLKKKYFGKKTKISNLNKLIITSITMLFFYLFYLSIPTLYDKTWVQNMVEKRLIDEFNINLSSSSEISYNILPSPHFLIKDSKILIVHSDKPAEIATIKKLKVFFFQSNFFKKENIVFKKVYINDANFSLRSRDLFFLKKTIDKKFSKKKININNSKVFFKDDEDNTVAIIKMPQALFFYDNLKLNNIFRVKGEIFKAPFNLNLLKNFDSKKIETLISSDKLKLKVSNEYSNLTDKIAEGLMSISVLNFKTQTKYEIEENLIFFESDQTTVKNPNFNYKGRLFTKPFNVAFDIELKKYELSKILNLESIFAELIKNEILLNDNISANTSIAIQENKNSELFDSSLVNLNITNGAINFNKSKFINNKIGFLEISNSNLSYTNNDLVLNTDILIDIKNSDSLFSLLQTPKNLRTDIKSIKVNLDFNFLSNQIDVNRIKVGDIDDNDQALKILKELNDIDNLNFHKARRIFNNVFAAYFG
jgi:hypothetical protein